jgi:hypothetical protein
MYLLTMSGQGRERQVEEGCATPRSACRALTTGAKDQSGSVASMWASSRSRRAVAASTAAIQSSSNVLHRLLELEARKPSSVHQCPGWPVIVTAVAPQKPGQLLTRLTRCTNRRLSRTHEIADGLVRLIRNPDRGQLTRAVQLGEVDRVPPVSLACVSCSDHFYPRSWWADENVLATSLAPIS